MEVALDGVEMCRVRESVHEKEKKVEKMLLLLFLFLVFIIILLYLRVTVVYDYPETTPIPFDLETGDILGVSYHNSLGCFITFWSKSAWSHTGMVYKDKEGKLFIAEAARYRNTDFQNVFLIPLDTWLSLNKKTTIAVSKYKGKKISDKHFHRAFNVIKDYKLDKFSYRWARLLLTEDYTEDYKQRERLTCNEILIMLLQEIGIVDKHRNPSSYWAADVVHGRLPFRKGYSYESPLLIQDRRKNMYSK